METMSELTTFIRNIINKLTPFELACLRTKLEVEETVIVPIEARLDKKLALTVHRYSTHLGKVVFKDGNDLEYVLDRDDQMWDGTTVYHLRCTNDNDNDYDLEVVFPIGKHTDLVERLKRFHDEFVDYKHEGRGLNWLLHDYGDIERIEKMKEELEWGIDNLMSETSDRPQWVWDTLRYYLPEMRELIQKDPPINP